MELEQATAIAAALVQELGPYCQTIVVAGSIRRQQPLPRDIDIVLIPANQGQLAVKLHELGMLGGSKILRAFYRGAPVDLYLASEETWGTLLLIRTGSKEHNIKLCSLALRKGMKLHADGRGLFSDAGKRLAGETEESVFVALGIPFRAPRDREVTTPPAKAGSPPADMGIAFGRDLAPSLSGLGAGTPL